MFRGKNYKESAKLFDRQAQYPAQEAFDIVCKASKAKFDETVELHVRLGVDGRHADQQVRGAIVLPHGTGKTARVLVFCKEDKVQDALNAGADYAGGMDLVEKIQKENWFEFDVVIATPDMMGTVGRLGKVLGPKGLMPSPKAGTVTPNIVQAVQESKAGKIEYRLDKTNIIHCPIGKVSFGAEKLFENYDALINAIIKAKPASAKGTYIKSCVTASTMGPGVKFAAKQTVNGLLRDKMAPDLNGQAPFYCFRLEIRHAAQGRANIGVVHALLGKAGGVHVAGVHLVVPGQFRQAL